MSISLEITILRKLLELERIAGRLVMTIVYQFLRYISHRLYSHLTTISANYTCCRQNVPLWSKTLMTHISWWRCLGFTWDWMNVTSASSQWSFEFMLRDSKCLTYSIAWLFCMLFHELLPQRACTSRNLTQIFHHYLNDGYWVILFRSVMGNF